jgi:glutamyl-tRNA reductase
VILLDLDALAPAGTACTPDAVEAARQLVAQEVRSYLLAQWTAEVIPTVAALRTWRSEVVDLELRRLDVRATST